MTMLRIRVAWNVPGGSPGLSTFYFAGSNQTDATNCSSAVDTLLAAIEPYQDTETTYKVDPTCVAMDESSGAIIGAFGISGTTGAGNVVGESIPFACQALAQLRTNVYVNGREIRGRLFIPGLTESQVTNGVVSSAALSGLNAAFGALVADADADYVVWSRRNGQDSPVTAVTVWEQLAVLRSRRPGF